MVQMDSTSADECSAVTACEKSESRKRSRCSSGCEDFKEPPRKHKSIASIEPVPSCCPSSSRFNDSEVGCEILNMQDQFLGKSNVEKVYEADLAKEHSGNESLRKGQSKRETQAKGDAQADAIKRNDELEYPKGEVSDARSSLKSSDETVNILSERLEKARSELISLRQKLNDVFTEELWEAKDQLRSSQNAVVLLSERLEEAHEQLKTLKSNTPEGTNKVKLETKFEFEIVAKMEKTGEQLKKLKDFFDSNSGPSEKFALVVENLRKTHQELEFIVNSAHDQLGSSTDKATIDELTHAKQELSEELENSNKRLEEAQSKLRGSEESRKSTMAALLESEQQLKSTNRTVSLLTQSLDEARAELSALRSARANSANREVTPPSLVETGVDDKIVVETEELSLDIAGRVIGKGGETVRDLQARSGAKLDVDHSLLPGQPRTLTYQGPHSKVQFAKELVRLIASGVSETSLPLGEAKQEVVAIASRIIGKVIGRGGSILREIQNRSHAKIDLDHGGTGAAVVTEDDKTLVVITGTPQSLVKAKEMILFIVGNPDMDALQLLNVLVDDKLRGGSSWGSGPPYPNLPNQGSGMTINMFDTAGSSGPSPPSSLLSKNNLKPLSVPSSEAVGYHFSELIYCKKHSIGRIIGSKGSTIKDLQKRSCTLIQIKQDVPVGADCEVMISGTRDGVAMAKQMIQQIVDGGADHLFGLGRTAGSNAKGQSISQIASVQASNVTDMSRDQGLLSSRLNSATTEDAAWKLMRSPGGQTYYWNKMTGATQWEKPFLSS